MSQEFSLVHLEAQILQNLHPPLLIGEIHLAKLQAPLHLPSLRHGAQGWPIQTSGRAGRAGLSGSWWFWGSNMFDIGLLLAAVFGVGWATNRLSRWPKDPLKSGHSWDTKAPILGRLDSSWAICAMGPRALGGDVYKGVAETGRN